MFNRLSPLRRRLATCAALTTVNVALLIGISLSFQQASRAAELTLEFEDDIAALREAILAANAPGNDVFLSRTPATEQSRLDRAEPRLTASLRQVQRIDAQSPIPDSIRTIAGEMIATERQLLKEFASGRHAQASATMAAMDQALPRINALIARYESAHRAAAGARVARQLSIIEVFAAAIAILILAAVVHGRSLTYHIGDAERRQAQLLAEAEAARQRAESADLAKSRFLANMTHEIRTPLSGVIGLTGLLLDMELGRDQREFARMIQHSGKSLLSVLNDVLDFSKIEAGRLELEVADFELRTALDDVMRVIGVAAHQRGVELVADVDFDLPITVRGDAVRLRQVVTNLVSNALKFSAPGGMVHLRARGDVGADGGLLLRVEVEDHGIGISAEAQQRLFAPFHQADASTTRKYGGTGLGLAICRRLITLMGGEIGVTSEPGIGSTFWFTCPLRAAESPVLAVRTSLAGLSILVVDDHEVARRVTKEVLRRAQAKVTDVDSGDAALERVRTAGPFDAIVIDGMMPGLDGPATISHLRAAGLTPMPRLVLLTSGELGESAQVAHGADVLLIKPAAQEDLLRALRPVAMPNATALPDMPPVSLGLHVLVAEDEPVNQMVIAALLERLGCTVVPVGDGSEAVSRATTESFDAILMDFHMPEMDGVDATREIRAAEATAHRPRVPIVALTALATEDARLAALEAGMDHFLTKPVDPSALQHCLETCAPHAGAAAPASTTA